jgi:hypothetical protein
MLVFYGDGLIVVRASLNAEDHPLLAVCDCKPFVATGC